VIVAQNRERRNEYLAAGGIVVVVLLGAAWLVTRPAPFSGDRSRDSGSTNG
jgi:hypothetical protein